MSDNEIDIEKKEAHDVKRARVTWVIQSRRNFHSRRPRRHRRR